MATPAILKQVRDIRLEGLKFTYKCIKEEFGKKVDTPQIIWAKYCFGLIQATNGVPMGPISDYWESLEIGFQVEDFYQQVIKSLTFFVLQMLNE